MHVEEEVEVDGGSDVVGAGDEGGSVGSSETGGVLVGNSLEEEPLELRTTLCALAGSPSLEARVTSMKSAVHDERGSVFFCRNSAPPSISSYWRRALPRLHSLGNWGQDLLGVQGERKGGANGEREGEGF